MAKTHRRQHIVPRSYLAAWHDPDTPESYDPYVWVWTKLGTSPRRKSPENLFVQTDMYTVMKDGQRLLHLEEGLKELEDNFARIRRKVLLPGRSLTPNDRIQIAAFTAALLARTMAQKQHHQAQFGMIADRMQQLAAQVEVGCIPRPELLASPSTEGASIDLDEVRAIAEQPLDLLLPAAVELLTPCYAAMNFAIVRAPEGFHFITSDNPVIMHDPTRRPGSSYSIAPGSPTIELTLPVSPHLCLIVAHKVRDGYCDAPIRLVQQVNDRIRRQCEGHYVSMSREGTNDIFTPLPMLGHPLG